MADACRTIGMDAVGFALEEGFDPTTQAWPRFVPVIRLSRHRGLTNGVAFALKYQQEHAGFEVARADLVTTPMGVHRQLQVQYQRLQNPNPNPNLTLTLTLTPTLALTLTLT